MMCSAAVATSSSWARLRVRGAHPGEAAHARGVVLLRTPAMVRAEMAPPKSAATCSRAWRRVIEARLTASLPPSTWRPRSMLPFVPGGELENAPEPDPPEAAPACRCRLWAFETPLRDGRTSCNIGRGQREMTRTGSGAQQTIDRREALRRAALLLGVEGLPLGPSAREGSRATSSTEQFLARKYDLGEVERELSAQVERALRSDLKISYVDYHMGTAVATPQLPAVVERIAQKYGLGILRYFGEAYHTMFDTPTTGSLTPLCGGVFPSPQHRPHKANPGKT